MKNITFHFVLSGDAGLRPTGLPDWIAFGYVCFVSVVLVTCILFMIARRKYAPLKAKDLSKLIAMTIFGIIHTWGAFVTNDHFESLRNAQQFECSLFAFWIQYFLGLNLWLIVLILRLKTYTWIFHDADNHSNPMRFIRWQAITTVALVLPILLICLITSLLNGIVWEPIHGHCVTQLPYKVLLLTWIVFGLATMIYFHIRIRKKLTTEHYREYEPLGSVVQAGIIVVVGNGLIIFFGGLTFSIGRAIATCLVASLHLFTLLRFAGYEVFKAMSCDKTYEDSFLRKQRGLLTRGVTINDLKEDEIIIEDFLFYCLNKEPVMFKSSSEGSGDIIISPKPLIKCREAMQKWVSDYQKVSDTAKTLYYNQIMDQYLSWKSKDYIFIDKNMVNRVKCFETEVVSQTVFDEIIEHIPAFLGKFYGTRYLEVDVYKRPIYANLLTSRLGTEHAFGVISRLGEFKLLDPLSVHAYIFGEEEEDMVELNLLSENE